MSVSESTPNSFSERYFVNQSTAAGMLDAKATTLQEHISPYLHYLSLTIPKAKKLFVRPYIETIVNSRDPTSSLSDFVKKFAQEPLATELVATTEQAFNHAIRDQILNVNGRLRVINTAGIIHLLGVAPPVVNAWADQGLKRVTFPGNRRPMGNFTPESFVNLIKWHRPRLPER